MYVYVYVCVSMCEYLSIYRYVCLSVYLSILFLSFYYLLLLLLLLLLDILLLLSLLIIPFFFYFFFIHFFLFLLLYFSSSSSCYSRYIVSLLGIIHNTKTMLKKIQLYSTSNLSIHTKNLVRAIIGVVP